MRHVTALTALAVALAVVGCGDGSSAMSGGAGEAGSTTQGGDTTSTTESAGATRGAGAGSSSGDVASGSTAGGQGGSANLCGSCGTSTDAGIIANPEIAELSGLAASRLHEGVLYAHNDSGDEPRFFAMTLAGVDRGTFSVTNATSEDWEEMSAGPCADGALGCLYFADFGDNDEERDDLVLYRVREPASVGEGLEAEVEAEAFPFSYPDGPHNAEAFVVHPTTGVVTIFTKGVTSLVFELAPPFTAAMVAVARGEIALDSFVSLATGADIDPSGRVLAIRTYADVLLFPIAEGGSVADALAQPSCPAPHGVESQGESVAFLLNGTSFVTASEGQASELHLVDCP